MTILLHSSMTTASMLVPSNWEHIFGAGSVELEVFGCQAHVHVDLQILQQFSTADYKPRLVHEVVKKA